jgi:integrase/recombinase XerD
MNINEMLDNYLSNSQITKAYGTYKGEVTIVKSIKRCLNELDIKTVNDLKYNSYSRIINYYRTQTRSKNASIYKYTAYLKAVLRYFGFVKHEFLLIKKLKDDTIHTRVIHSNDLELILRYIYHRNTSVNSIVHKAAIFLLYDTGCRIGELLNIKIMNINFKDRTILLEQTKNKKPRYVFFTKLSEQIIKDLISVNPQSIWLLWNIEKNKRFDRDSDMKYLLKMLKRNLGINKLSNHMFRKTMATELVSKGAKLKTVQTILGHESQKTTEIYIEFDTLDAKKDYESIKTMI